MVSCKLAFSVLFLVATCFWTPALTASSWESLGKTTSTSSNAQPGARTGAASWATPSAFWMFSGMGNEATQTTGYLSTLYRYNATAANSAWQLINGGTQVNNVAVFPAQIGSAGSPGGRTGAASWYDPTGALWVFGGNGLASTTTPGLLNDLWKFTQPTAANPQGQWLFYGGLQTAGTTPTDSTRPTPREGAAFWSNGANFYLSGGNGLALNGKTATLLTDTWMWSSTGSTWSLVNNGTGTGAPVARYQSASTNDASGNGWFFGGRNAASVPLADLIQYSQTQMTLTTKYAGTANQTATYPAVIPGAGNPAAEFNANGVVSSGSFYLFGGLSAFGASRDLYKYNPTTNAWTYVAGDKGGKLGSATLPGARSSAAAQAVNGYLYVFGGSGYDTTGVNNITTIGDFWRVQLCGLDNTCVAPNGTTTASSSTTGGSQPVETTTEATVEVVIVAVGDPAAVDTVAISNGLATTLGVPSSWITTTVEEVTRAVNKTFRIVVTVTYPNSSAIAAATGGNANGNITALLPALQSQVTNAVNTTTTTTLKNAGIAVTGVTSSVAAVPVPVGTSTGISGTTGTTGRVNAAAGFSPSILLSAFVVLVASPLAALLL